MCAVTPGEPVMREHFGNRAPVRNVSTQQARIYRNQLHARAYLGGCSFAPAAMAMSMNAVIGDVTNRNRLGPGFVPIGPEASCAATYWP